MVPHVYWHIQYLPILVLLPHVVRELLLEVH